MLLREFTTDCSRCMWSAALCPVGGHQKLPTEDVAITPDLRFTGVFSFNITCLGIMLFLKLNGIAKGEISSEF